MAIDYISLARSNREIALANRGKHRLPGAVSDGGWVHTRAARRNSVAIFVSSRSFDAYSQVAS